MNGMPIHENLSTSFTDVAALVRHLRSVQFTGTVRIELASYEAEIIFTPANRLQAREYDKFVGRIAQGEHAFDRILKRAREPHGRISVVRVDPIETVEYLKKAFVDDRIVTQARESAGVREGLAVIPTAGYANHSREVIPLATELLLTIKEAFAKTRMDFEAAFANACAFVEDEYPLLSDEKFTFRYDEIRVSLRATDVEIFDAVVGALEHVFQKLRSDKRFSKLLVYTRHRIQQHLSVRNYEYRTLRLVPIVDRLLS